MLVFVSFSRQLQFWELEFRSRSFLYKQVLYRVGSPYTENLHQPLSLPCLTPLQDLKAPCRYYILAEAVPIVQLGKLRLKGEVHAWGCRANL